MSVIIWIADLCFLQRVGIVSCLSLFHEDTTSVEKLINKRLPSVEFLCVKSRLGNLQIIQFLVLIVANMYYIALICFIVV